MTNAQAITPIQALQYTEARRLSAGEAARIVCASFRFGLDDAEHVVDADGAFVADTLADVADALERLDWIRHYPDKQWGHFPHWPAIPGALDGGNGDLQAAALLRAEIGQEGPRTR